MRNEAEDLKILATAFFKELFISDCEYGAIGIDCKRPFGNSDVEGDILEKLIPYLREQWKLMATNP